MGSPASSVDRVESTVLRSVLAKVRPERTLDAGSGAGRLLPWLGSAGEGYCGVDRDREAVRVAVGERHGLLPGCWLVADVHRLPFRAATFDLAVMVRVYHRLHDPSAALAELARVLRPGGFLLFSCYPRPSVRTLYQDVVMALNGRGPAGSLTFARGPVTEVAWGDRPGRVETLAFTEGRLEGAGFRVRERYVSGFEELPFFRSLSAEHWSRWSGPRRSLPLAPCVFYLAERVEPDGRMAGAVGRTSASAEKSP